MPTDPAELILFGEMSPNLFFEEAQRLGIPLRHLDDEETHNRVLRGCLIKVRKATAKAVAAELGIPITDEQAHSIAKNSLTPEVIAEPAPLATDEREIAKQLYFHSVKAAVGRQGSGADDDARVGQLSRASDEGQDRGLGQGEVVGLVKGGHSDRLHGGRA